jgi:hypothetical protein
MCHGECKLGGDKGGEREKEKKKEVIDHGPTPSLFLSHSLSLCIHALWSFSLCLKVKKKRGDASAGQETKLSFFSGDVLFSVQCKKLFPSFFLSVVSISLHSPSNNPTHLPTYPPFHSTAQPIRHIPHGRLSLCKQTIDNNDGCALRSHNRMHVSGEQERVLALIPSQTPHLCLCLHVPSEQEPQHQRLFFNIYASTSIKLAPPNHTFLLVL